MFKTLLSLSFSFLLANLSQARLSSVDEQIVADFVDLYSELSPENFLPIKNSTCITRHCMGQITKCIGDSMCRQNMQCSGKCPKDNTTCTFVCTESYQTPVVGDMMKCLFVDHECLSLPPPDPLNNATCREPTTYVESVDETLLNGEWFVVQGFNPLYDCFECQELTFVVNDGKLDYEALFNMIAANGTEIWVTAEMTGDDSTTPGILQMDGMENGLPDHQNWYVMHLSEDTMVVYYCGSVISWHFEGLLVMSKTKELNQDRMADIAAILADLDISQDDICVLNPEQNCSASPAQIFTQ